MEHKTDMKVCERVLRAFVSRECTRRVPNH